MTLPRMTVDQAKARLRRACADGDAAAGASNAPAEFVAAVDAFPDQDRMNLARLAPEMRIVLEDVLRAVGIEPLAQGRKATHR